MYFHPNEKLALFIDGSNLFATAKSLNFDIDYKRLRSFFEKKRNPAQGKLLYRSIRRSGIFTPSPACGLAGL